MKSNAFRATAGACLAAVMLLAGGCTTYELGSALPPDIESVYIPSVVNATEEPLLESAVTREVLREFQRDGTLRLADEASADARLDIRLVGFELEAIKFERDDTRATQVYQMRIDAEVKLTRAGETAPMMERKMLGDTFFDFFGDLASSKTTATPLAARDLAHDIVESLVEYW